MLIGTKSPSRMSCSSIWRWTTFQPACRSGRPRPPSNTHANTPGRQTDWYDRRDSWPVRPRICRSLSAEISDTMRDISVWAVSLAFESSTHHDQSFFDIRVRLCFKGRLSNIHLVGLPMFDRHTAKSIFNMLNHFWTRSIQTGAANCYTFCGVARNHDRATR